MGLGEIFKLSFLNTLLGMGTVFIVLIIISYIISLFKYIAPKAKEKEAEKKEEQPVVQAAVPEEVEEPEEIEEEDDLQLAAVITAALYASMSAKGVENPGSYVVRRIRRI